jgi:hypothetical protein
MRIIFIQFVFIRVHSRLILHELSLGMYKSNRVRVQRQVAHIHVSV